MNQNPDATVILRVASAVHSTLDIDVVFRQVLASVQEGLRAEASSLILVDEDRGKLVFRGATGEKAESIKQFELNMGEGIAGWVVQHGEPVVTRDAHSDPRHMAQVDGALDFCTRAMITVPLRLDGRVIGALQVLNPADGPDFGPDALALMEAVAEQVAVAIRNARMYATVQQNKEGLEELLGLRDRVVGESPAMKALLARVAELGHSDKPVILVGEPGVGKTLLAHAIHEAGPRQSEAFTVLRCDKTSEGDLAAALFGRGQGEPGLLARPGSVYLREVAALSPALAQRLAQAAPDAAARILAGTSRVTKADDAPSVLPNSLFEEGGAVVAEVPPLRERPEDIPHLAGYFVQRANTRLGRNVKGVDHEVLRFFMNRLWRGNVRELEDLVVRAIAASDGHGMMRMGSLAKVVDVQGLAGLASAAARLEPWGRSASPEDLFAALRSEDPSTRSAALDEIGRAKPAGAAEQIVATVLRDSQHFIRLRAVQLLGELGAPCGLAPLLELLPHEADTDILGATLTSLSLLAGDAPAAREKVRSALLLHLRDANPRLRLSAVRGLARLGAGDAIEPLQGMTNDEHAPVRCEVNLALYRFGEAEALARLKAELDQTDLAVRAAACEALGETGKAVAELIALMDRDPSPDVRLCATEALGHTASAEAVKPLLYKLDDPLLRMTAIRSLGRLCTQTQLAETECVAALLGVVADEKSSMVRRTALEALGTVGDAHAAARLREFIDDPRIAASVIAAIGQIGGAEAEDALIPLLKPGPFCTDAIEAIAGVGTAKSVGPLVALLAADDYAAQKAAHALVAIGDGAQDALIAGLTDERKRHWCAYGLGALRSAKAIPHLMAIYDESEAARSAVVEIGEQGLEAMLALLPQYRRAAAEVCLKLGEAAAPHLLRAFHEGDPFLCDFAESVLVDIGSVAADTVIEALGRAESAATKARLAGMLARVGGASHASALEPLLDDASVDVRRATIHALGRLGGTHAAKTLAARVQASESAAPSYRQDRIACLEALRQIGSREALEAIVGALNAESWTVRLAAVEALAAFDSAQVADQLLRATHDRDNRVARAAAKAVEAMGLLDAAALSAQALDRDARPPERREATKTLCLMTNSRAKDALADVWSQGDEATQRAIIDELAGEGAAAIGWLARLMQSDQEGRAAFARAVAERLCFHPLAVERSVADLGRRDPGAGDLLRGHLLAHRSEATAALEALLRNTSDETLRRNVVQLLDDLSDAEER